MKPLPFPFELIVDCPALATADALVLGATVSLAAAYWKSGCSPLPKDEAGLAITAKCHTRRWYLIKDRVETALNALLPVLTNVYAKTHSAAFARQTKARKAAHASVVSRKLQGKPTAEKSLFPASNMQSVLRPPFVFSKSAAKTTAPNDGVVRLSDPKNSALPLQPTCLPKAHAPQKTRKNKGRVWLSDLHNSPKATIA